MERIEGGGKRLSKREAIAHQSYATAREGRSFSERALPEAYTEAEMFVEQLKRPEFNWLEIDWDKIDLRKIEDIKDVERRLDTAVRIAMEKDDSKLTVRDFLKKHKSVLNLAMSVALLLSPACSNVDKARYEKRVTELSQIKERAGKSHVRIYVYEGDKLAQYERYIDVMSKWKEGHPEIKEVELLSAFDKNERYEGHYGGERFYAAVELVSVDGYIYKGRAESDGGIEKAIEAALENARDHMSRLRKEEHRMGRF